MLHQKNSISKYFYHILLFFIFLFFYSESKSQCTAVIGSNISPIKGCEILTVQFNDLSTGPVQNRTWNFGDGSTTSGAQNPSHSYVSGVNGDTLYIVTLSIQCVTGPPSTSTDTVKVYKKPKVLFFANDSTLCALTDSACFHNLSNSGTGYTFSWNFGDGSPLSSQFQPCHIYTTGGNYSPQLTVTNNNGCVNSLTKNNYINVIPSPSPDFTLSSFSGCAPFSANITNTTDTLTTSFSAWQWNFGEIGR